MLEINEWVHVCNDRDLPTEFLEDNVNDSFDPIIGNPSDTAIDWGIGTGHERKGGGYFRFCPYCGAQLPQTHDEAMGELSHA